MKRTKRIFAIFMTLALAMSMLIVSSAVSFADGYTVTIQKDPSDKATHSYEAYKIFAGDLKDGKLSNITWGNGIDQSQLGDLATAINALRDPSATGYKALTADSSASDFADAIAKLNAEDDSATAQKVASALGAALSSTKAGTGSATGVSGLDNGYYLVKDQADSLADKDGAYTRFVLQVVGADVTVQEKASVPSVEKKVDDKNDSNTSEDATTWEDSADYDIGDAVPFKLTATTASTVHDYTKYHVTFQDKQSPALNAPAKFTVTVDGTSLPELTNTVGQKVSGTVSGAAVTAEVVTAASGNTFAIKVSFEGANGAKLAGLDSKAIVITYDSVLNSDAEIGMPGNPNEVYLNYSNNPNSTDDSEEGKTPEDKVIVFTYKTEVNKTKEDGSKLTGAGFTLYKKVMGTKNADGETVYPANAKAGSAIKAELAERNASIEASALENNSYYIKLEMAATASDTSIFTYEGIDDGTYVIVETTIPDGYNAFKSEVVEVTATHTQDAGEKPLELTELNGGDRFTGNVTTGTLTGTIKNKSGATLPSTGGIGTIIFYVLGSLLVVGCGIVLISKRRMESR
jgi:fimbrial isopeptide formation D2 family protein/LPXTG-motif cell wall-anchored protein